MRSARLPTLLAALAAVFVFAAPSARAEEWTMDPAHSSVTFSVRHMMISTVKGSFTDFRGTLNWDAQNPTQSTMSAAIDPSSISTNDAKRDEHLRSADFFDVAKFPTIAFASNKVEKVGKKLRVSGVMIMHGVTKPMVLEVTMPSNSVVDPYGRTIMAATATGTLNRKDFGMAWNKALDQGGVAVGEEISFAIELELVKTAPAAQAKAGK